MILTNMRGHWKRTGGWLPVVILVIASVLLLALGRHRGLSDDAVGGLVGSLIGAAAILSGVLFDRRQRRADELEEREERHRKLKTIIAAELVNVASGLISAKRFVDAAVHQATFTDPGSKVDLSGQLPRPMPITNNLGVELLILTPREIDVLTTLRSNLTITEASMREETESKQAFGLLASKKIQGGIQHDMGILAEGFAEIAPDRKLALEGRAPELASACLARMSTETKD